MDLEIHSIVVLPLSVANEYIIMPAHIEATSTVTVGEQNNAIETNWHVYCNIMASWKDPGCSHSVEESPRLIPAIIVHMQGFPTTLHSSFSFIPVET